MRIHIPNPCHENWNGMIPNNQGHFCGACSKTVIDFTQMTDDEVLSFLTAHKGEKICGRIKNKPVVSEIVITIPRIAMHKKQSFFQTFLLAVLLCFGVIVSSGYITKQRAAFIIETAQQIATTDTPPPLPPIDLSMYTTGEVIGGIEEMPQYPGGDSAMKNYITQKLAKVDYTKYNDSFPRKVYLQFTIDTAGQTKDVEIMKGSMDSTFNTQIINIIEQMPKWEGDIKTDKRMTLPIKIKPKE